MSEWFSLFNSSFPAVGEGRRRETAHSNAVLYFLQVLASKGQ